jgi:hypothetical protein
MLSYFILENLAAICLFYPLMRGALKDIKTRTFPAEYWNTPGKIAGFFLVMAYLLMIADGLYWQIFLIVISSAIAALIFAFMGYRFCGGGDWRALIYISLLAPMILFTFTFWVSTGIASLGVAFAALSVKDESTHLFKRHIPWSLAIFIGYFITLVFILLTGGAG